MLPGFEKRESAEASDDVTQSGLAQWINANGTDYVAHAIWSNNVEGVFSTGSLDPAEYQLRSKRTVSHEQAMYGFRGTVTLPDIKFLTDEDIRSLQRIAPVNRISGADALSLGIINNKTYKNILRDKKKSIVINGKEFAVTIKESFRTKVNTESESESESESNSSMDISFHIEGIPFVEKKWADFSKLKPTNCSSEAFYIYVDAYSEKPVDLTLAHMWEFYTSLKPQINREKLAEKLREFRSYAIPDSHLNCEIRCCKNQIAWGYGDVVVLRGKGDEVLSAWQPFKTGEVLLRRPFENKGKGFSLALNDERTIVLGPKAVSEQYKNVTQGIQFFAFEEMSKEQLDFFKVPEHLWSYKHRMEVMKGCWDSKQTDYLDIQKRKNNAIQEALKVLDDEKTDQGRKEGLLSHFGICKQGKDYIVPSEAKDYCENGICEIVGKRYEQQDSVAYSLLDEFNTFDAKTQEYLLKSTFHEMQSLYGNYDEEGSTACMTVSWLETKHHQTKIKYCNANVGDSASFLIILDAKNNVVQSKKINSIRDSKLVHSIGDKKLESTGLKHDPDITSGEVELEEGQRAFMITACDGLTETMFSNKKSEQTKAQVEENQIAECVAKVAKHNSQDIESEMAFQFTKMAFERGSADNITVIAKEITKKPKAGAVFDGHGGTSVSKALGKHALPCLIDKISYYNKFFHSSVETINSAHNTCGIKKDMLNQLANKIFELRRRAGQYDKVYALIDIYMVFDQTNLNQYESVKTCQKVIEKNLKNLEGFSSSFGKMGAWLKQSIFQTGYVNTMSDTRLQVAKLNDWIERNALPAERVRVQLRESRAHSKLVRY